MLKKIQRKRFYHLQKGRRKKENKDEDETEVWETGAESNHNCLCSSTGPYLCCWPGDGWWGQGWYSLLKLLPGTTHSLYKVEIKLLIKLDRPAEGHVVSLAVWVRKDVRNARWKRKYRTERVTKYTSCSKSFELFRDSVPFDPPSGRLREGERLLAWLPKELRTGYHQWLFVPMCAWLFEYRAILDVLKHLRLLRRVAASQKGSPFSANLWDGWKSASPGQESDNSTVNWYGCKCLFLCTVGTRVSTPRHSTLPLTYLYTNICSL